MQQAGSAGRQAGSAGRQAGSAGRQSVGHVVRHGDSSQTRQLDSRRKGRQYLLGRQAFLHDWMEIDVAGPPSPSATYSPVHMYVCNVWVPTISSKPFFAREEIHNNLDTILFTCNCLFQMVGTPFLGLLGFALRCSGDGGPATGDDCVRGQRLYPRTVIMISAGVVGVIYNDMQDETFRRRWFGAWVHKNHE